MYSFYLRYRNTTANNILDPSDVLDNVRVVGNTGNQSVNTEYVSTKKVSLEGLSNLYLNIQFGYTCTDISFFDENETYIEGVNSAQGLQNIAVNQSYRFAIFSFFRGTSTRTDLTESYVTNSSSVETAPYFNTVNIHPAYGKLDIDIKRPKNEHYITNRLKGNLILLKSEFDLVESLDIDEYFYIDCIYSSSVLQNYVLKLSKTDCEFDRDDRSVKIPIKVDDAYRKINAVKNDVINILSLRPEKKTVSYLARPIYQIYVAGANSITNYWGGTTSQKEINIDPVFDETALVDTYKFHKQKTEYYISKSNNLSLDIYGIWGFAENSNSTYGFRISSQSESAENKSYAIRLVSRTVNLVVENRYIIYDTNTNHDKYQTDWFVISDRVQASNYYFYGINGNTGGFNFSSKQIYVRKLLNSGSPTYSTSGTIHSKPSNDIYEFNRNYKYIEQGAFTGFVFFMYQKTRPQKTKYGKMLEASLPHTGEFFKHPGGIPVFSSASMSNSTQLVDVNTFSESDWGELSFWFRSPLNQNFGSAHPTIDLKGSKSLYSADFYELHEIIKTLFVQNNINVSFDDSPEYSEFLYGDVSSSVYNGIQESSIGVLSPNVFGVYFQKRNTRLAFTAKSNISISDYEKPANKLEMSLNSIFQFLREHKKLYWFVENGRLRIEHVSFFMRGGSYTSDDFGADLTTSFDPRNNKHFSFSQNKYEFTKEEMVRGYKADWMDDVTKSFESSNVEILSKRAQEENFKDVNYGSFTSDIDFIISNPNEISKDGAMVVELDGSNVAFHTMKDSPSNRVFMQNGFLSNSFAFEFLHVYNLPSDRVKINEKIINISSKNISRNRKQKIDIPQIISVNPYLLVTTDLGTGLVESMEVNVESLYSKTEILLNDE